MPSRVPEFEKQYRLRQVRKFTEQGKTGPQIAEIMGISVHKVLRVMKDNGIEPAYLRARRERVDAALELVRPYANGTRTLAQIIELTGLTDNQVRGALRKLERGVPNSTVRSVEAAEMIVARCRGVTVKQIARDMDRAPSCVSAQLKAHGMTFPDGVTRPTKEMLYSLRRRPAARAAYKLLAEERERHGKEAGPEEVRTA
ncbi:helix-turn-helix DNA binding protein [Rhodococcus phage Reynauld]|uniref:Helix-turn-helix DNA binding protein n=1 Tax=Rhodococcus phage Reynauld TaxID=3062845 RepID=A0ACD4UH88_9CAUD|nr:helix-turn-helix DNA binding protein [Rhodococcus phage Reynauld]